MSALALAAGLAALGCGDPTESAGAAGTETRAESLYVLDPNGESHTARIVRVDTGSGRVERSFPVGYDPAMTLSPDGSRLYAISAHPDGKDTLRDVLTVVDTTGGSVLAKAKVQDRWEGVGVTLHPTMATSPDGRLLYVLQGRVTGPDAAEYSVATFDTALYEFLPETVPLEGCGAGILLPSSQDAARRLQVACPNSHDVRIAEVGADGGAASMETIDLPVADDGQVDLNRNPLELWRLSSAVMAAGGDELYAITQNGRIYVVDVVAKAVARTVDLELEPGGFVAIGHAQVGAAGQLFLGMGNVSPESGIDRLRASEVVVVDAVTWDVERVVTPDHAFESMAASTLDDLVFTIDNDSRSVTVIDGQEDRPTSVIRNVGQTPTLAETAPATGS